MTHVALDLDTSVGSGPQLLQEPTNVLLFRSPDAGILGSAKPSYARLDSRRHVRLYVLCPLRKRSSHGRWVLLTARRPLVAEQREDEKRRASLLFPSATSRIPLPGHPWAFIDQSSETPKSYALRWPYCVIMPCVCHAYELAVRRFRSCLATPHTQNCLCMIFCGLHRESVFPPNDTLSLWCVRRIPFGALQCRDNHIQSPEIITSMR